MYVDDPGIVASVTGVEAKSWSRWVCNQNSDRRCKCKNCFSDKRHLIVLLLHMNTLAGLSLTYYRRSTTDYSKLSHTELFSSFLISGLIYTLLFQFVELLSCCVLLTWFVFI